MQKTVEVLQLALIDKVDDVPVVQVVVGSRGGASDSVYRQSSWTFHNETVTMLSAWLVMAAMKVFSAFFGHFRASQGCPGVERQFSEPSTMKSSSSSRAPAQ